MHSIDTASNIERSNELEKKSASNPLNNSALFKTPETRTRSRATFAEKVLKARAFFPSLQDGYGSPHEIFKRSALKYKQS